MYLPKKLKYIDEVDIHEKIVLLRIDMDLTLDASGDIVDDMRIQSALPTIEYILNQNTTIVLIGHM